MQLVRTAVTGTVIATAGSVALGAAAARRLLRPAPFVPPESELVYADERSVPGTEPDGVVGRTHVVHVHGQSLGPQQVLRGLRVWRELGASNQVVDTSDLPLRSLDPAAVDRVAAAAHAARAAEPNGWCCRVGPPAPSPPPPRRHARRSTASSGSHRSSTSGRPCAAP